MTAVWHRANASDRYQLSQQSRAVPDSASSFLLSDRTETSGLASERSTCGKAVQSPGTSRDLRLIPKALDPNMAGLQEGRPP
ncbi:unnamed protein product [Boreogadus saida]